VLRSTKLFRSRSAAALGDVVRFRSMFLTAGRGDRVTVDISRVHEIEELTES
jgi:hypothetical protein